MSDVRLPSVPSVSSSARRGTVVTSVVVLVLGVVEIGFGAFCWYVTETDPADDPLTAIGYLVALVIGVPGVVGLVLAGLGWLLADRVAGLVLAILAACAVAVPALLWLGVASPGF